MTPDLTCYGSDIAALADLVGDFDLRSPVDTRAWYGLQWEALAELLGFSQQLVLPAQSSPGVLSWIHRQRGVGGGIGEARKRSRRCARPTSTTASFGAFGS